MTFKLGFIFAAVLTLAAAPTASAQYYQNNGFSGNNGNQLAGGAIGALAGGVLGSRVAGRGDRTEGAVIGALVGGVAGLAVAGNGNNGGYSNGYSGGGYYNSYPAQGYVTSYRQPYYTNGYSGGGYYSRPSTSLNINLGLNSFSGNRGRGFNNRRINNRRINNNIGFNFGNRGGSRRNFNGRGRGYQTEVLYKLDKKAPIIGAFFLILFRS